uniref:Uncharacterized protein n=1 Tax=Rhizophora mucronata TaxID=61149 RepID=A0A2P2PB95_RHIMU
MQIKIVLQHSTTDLDELNVWLLPLLLLIQTLSKQLPFHIPGQSNHLRISITS